MGLSNKLSCEVGSFSHCLNPHRFIESDVLSLSFPCTGTLGCAVCIVPHLYLLVYPHTNMGPPGPPTTTLLSILSALSAHLCPSYWWMNVSSLTLWLSDFFNSLVVSSVFWKFWLFLVFKFVVVLLLLV